MITTEDKKVILPELIKGLKKELLATKINIRYIEREKISAGNEQLVKLEEAIKAQKLYVEGIEKKLDIAEDELAGR